MAPQVTSSLASTSTTATTSSTVARNSASSLSKSAPLISTTYTTDDAVSTNVASGGDPQHYAVSLLSDTPISNDAPLSTSTSTASGSVIRAAGSPTQTDSVASPTETASQDPEPEGGDQTLSLSDLANPTSAIQDVASFSSDSVSPSSISVTTTTGLGFNTPIVVPASSQSTVLSGAAHSPTPTGLGKPTGRSLVLIVFCACFFVFSIICIVAAVQWWTRRERAARRRPGRNRATMDGIPRTSWLNRHSRAPSLVPPSPIDTSTAQRASVISSLTLESPSAMMQAAPTQHWSPNEMSQKPRPMTPPEVLARMFGSLKRPRSGGSSSESASGSGSRGSWRGSWSGGTGSSRPGTMTKASELETVQEMTSPAYTLPNDPFASPMPFPRPSSPGL